MTEDARPAFTAIFSDAPGHRGALPADVAVQCGGREFYMLRPGGPERETAAVTAQAEALERKCLPVLLGCGLGRSSRRGRSRRRSRGFRSLVFLCAGREREDAKNKTQDQRKGKRDFFHGFPPDGFRQNFVFLCL